MAVVSPRVRTIRRRRQPDSYQPTLELPLLLLRVPRARGVVQVGLHRGLQRRLQLRVHLRLRRGLLQHLLELRVLVVVRIFPPPSAERQLSNDCIMNQYT